MWCCWLLLLCAPPTVACLLHDIDRDPLILAALCCGSRLLVDVCLCHRQRVGCSCCVRCLRCQADPRTAEIPRFHIWFVPPLLHSSCCASVFQICGLAGTLINGCEPVGVLLAACLGSHAMQALGSFGCRCYLWLCYSVQ
jgi:hypothetical protein